MNLFNQSTLSDLRLLVKAGKKSLPVHNIVVDYDGEVIIDPEMKFAGISLNRFKFHTQISQSVKNNANSMKMLLETLLDVYNQNSIQIQMHRGLKRLA